MPVAAWMSARLACEWARSGWAASTTIEGMVVAKPKVPATINRQALKDRAGSLSLGRMSSIRRVRIALNGGTHMFESMLSFPGGLFGEFDRLRRELDDVFGVAGMPASIRSVAPGSYPAINIGTTPGSVEIYAFAPGIDPTKVDVTIDRGVLTIAGERAPTAQDKDASVYSRERPSGS